MKLPVPVKIDAGDVGGPSAGLAFALDIMEELGRNVDHGHKVAATGELALDGTVGPIGGVKQKTIGARKADVDVFLVPAGENATEARRYADGLRIVPVKNFPQALRALATLPPENLNFTCNFRQVRTAPEIAVFSLQTSLIRLTKRPMIPPCSGRRSRGANWR